MHLVGYLYLIMLVGLRGERVVFLNNDENLIIDNLYKVPISKLDVRNI